MSFAEIKDWASVIGPGVAVVSVGLNIYLLRNRPHVTKVEEVRASLRNMLDKLDSRLLNIPAFQEQWDQGFLRLAEILPVCGQCDRTLMIAADGLVPNDIQRAVSEIHSSATNLYHLQDSFHNFQAGRPFVPYSDLPNWPDQGHATALLHALQNANNRHTDRLHKYLKQLSN
jgi:hypothetical protein